MARAVWKGPFVEESLIKKVEKVKNETNRKPINFCVNFHKISASILLFLF